MRQARSKLICGAHVRCEAAGCGEIVGRLPSLVHKVNGVDKLYHVMCAPPHVRKAYHERTR